MNEPLRTTPPDSGSLNEAEREARIEELLLAGLDHYFAGKYDQAINIWTRVAFLERGHGRARAYIERARSALAERQRESEELLHTGVAAYQAGDLQTARDLLNRAVDEGGAHETALVFLQRLGRLEGADQSPRLEAPGGVSLPNHHRAAPFSRPADRARRLVRAVLNPSARPASPSSNTRADGGATNWLTTIAASVAVGALIVLAAQPVASWLVELPAAAPVIEPAPAEPLPIVRASERRLSRARQLYADGRLRDALRTLADIDIADPLRGEADRVKGDVQRALLATVAATVLVPAGEATR